MGDKFITAVKAEAIRAAARYDALVSEWRELQRKANKIWREIDLLNSLLKYNGEQEINFDEITANFEKEMKNSGEK